MKGDQLSIEFPECSSTQDNGSMPAGDEIGLALKSALTHWHSSLFGRRVGQQLGRKRELGCAKSTYTLPKPFGRTKKPPKPLELFQAKEYSGEQVSLLRCSALFVAGVAIASVILVGCGNSERWFGRIDLLGKLGARGQGDKVIALLLLGYTWPLASSPTFLPCMTIPLLAIC